MTQPSARWDVAIVGAGMAGLGAARTLQSAGKRVVLLDKGRAPGGRVCTRLHDGCAFDHGAQNIKATGSELEIAAKPFGRAIVRRVIPPVRLHDNGEVLPPDEKNLRSNEEEKWAGANGLENFARELARDLPIWTSTRVSHLEETDDAIEVRGETEMLCATRFVIVTAPAPQSADLLETSRLRAPVEKRVQALREVNYNRCLTILLRFDAELRAEWYALLAQNREHPLLWLARENAKGYAVSSGAALVAQLGPQISAELYDAPDELIASRAVELVREAAPELRELPAPIWSHVKRWRYSQAQNRADWDAVNPSNARVLVAGDALCDKSRVELAYASGLRAARQILAS